MKIVQKDTIVQIVVNFNIFHNAIAMLYPIHLSFWGFMQIYYFRV